MKRKASIRLLGAAIVAVALVPWLSGGTASAVTKANSNTFLKAGQAPTTAAAFPDQQTDCPGFVVGGAFDVWHFVLDGSSHVFAELTAEFQGGTTVTVNPNDKHAYVKAPAGLTLVDAYAFATPDDATVPADFQLSHVCVGTPPPPPSSPPATTSSAPATTSSAPAATTAAASPSTSVKGVKNAKPPAVLPKTGSGLSTGMALAISLGLLLGGAALMFVPRALSADKGKRRH
jgi:hypothetical protein